MCIRDRPNTRCKNALQNAKFLECLRAGHAVFNSTTHDFFASRARIPVANVPDYCIEEVSNHAILLLLACAKRLNILERTVKEGKWDYSVTTVSYTHLDVYKRQCWEFRLPLPTPPR